MRKVWAASFLFLTFLASRVEAQNFRIGVGWRTYLTNPSVDNEYSSLGWLLWTGVGNTIQPPAYKQQLLYLRSWIGPFVGLEIGMIFANVSRTDENLPVGQNTADVSTSVRNFGFGSRLLLSPVWGEKFRLSFTMGFQFSNYNAKQDINVAGGGSGTTTIKGNVIRIPVGIAAEYMPHRHLPGCHHGYESHAPF